MYHQRFKTLEERFFEKVEKTDGCWNWTGGINSRGYGSFRIGEVSKHPLDSHRASWYIHFKEIPTQWVLHTCDNRKCVNPDHLYLGDHKQNVLDAVERKRFASGERHGTKTKPQSYTFSNEWLRKLTTDDMIRITALRDDGWSQDKIAKEFEVSQSTISYSLNR